MLPTPTISVVLPAYNVEQFIGEAVDSILAQTFTDFELIVIEDASTDSTLKILEAYNDPRIRIVRNERNLGLVKTLNKGLDLAAGEFIARMDGDDVSYPERFQKQVNYLRSHPHVDILGTWAYIFGATNYVRYASINHQGIKAHLLFINEIIHPSLMMRRQRMEQYKGRFDERFIKCEDYALWVDLIDKMRFAIMPEILLSYRVHENNYSILTKSNNEILKKWNMINQQTLLNRIGFNYSSEELELNYNICFEYNKHLSEVEFKKCLSWFGKIISANSISCYFNQQSLCNEIIEQLILLSRNTDNPPQKGNLFFYEIIPLVSFVRLLRYIPFKIIKSLYFHRNAAFAKRAGNKSFT